MASTIRGDDNFDSSNIIPTDYGAVGTYTMARTAASATQGRTPGLTRAGTDLHPCDTSRDYSSSITLSGTWRHMAYALYDNRGLIWVRIS